MEATLTSKSDVLIVSAFGRGNWLAAHLSEQDWSVTLIDVTPSLGAWEPADWDGPFGLFESDALLASQKRQWLQDGEIAPGGFTFWLPSGPLEGYGELSGFLSGQHSIATEARTYLQLLGDVEDHELRRERSSLRARDYEDSWLAHLVHQVSGNVYEDNDVALMSGRAIPFYAPYFQRNAHAGLLEEGLKVCEARGVKVIGAGEIRSLKFEGSWPSRAWRSLTLANGTELSAHAGVWTLSSIETQALNATLVSDLFPHGSLLPSWSWLRFEMSAARSRVTDSMPAGFTIVGDVFLPWTHANLAHVRKQNVEVKNSRVGLDIWVRVPVPFRFDRDYLARVQRELLALLQAKLPASDVQAERLPLDLDRGEEQCPIPRWPLYTNGEQAQPIKVKNFAIDGPERWRGLDPLAQFQSQKKVLATLEQQKRLRDERLARDELRAQKRTAKELAKEVARQDARKKAQQQKEHHRD